MYRSVGSRPIIYNAMSGLKAFDVSPSTCRLWLIDDAVRDSWLKRHGAKISMPKVIGDAEDGVSMLKVGGGARAVA